MILKFLCFVLINAVIIQSQAVFKRSEGSSDANLNAANQTDPATNETNSENETDSAGGPGFVSSVGTKFIDKAVDTTVDRSVNKTLGLAFHHLGNLVNVITGQSTTVSAPEIPRINTVYENLAAYPASNPTPKPVTKPPPKPVTKPAAKSQRPVKTKRTTKRHKIKRPKHGRG